MRPKTMILLVLALGCGLVASVGISQMLQRNQDNGPPTDTAPVWVVKSEIKAEDPLTMQNLQLEQWPKEKIPPGALSKMEEITDKRTRVNLYQGEPVLAKKVLDKNESTAGSEIPKGWRLYTVQGDAISSHGGLLHPGDRVDVLVFVQKGVVGIEAGTKTILQDIKVFAVNDQVRTSEDNKGSDSITAKTVTLLVTPSAAEKLALANEIGKIKLVMRGPGDQDTVNPAGTQIESLFGTEKMDRNAEETNRPAQAPSLTAVLNPQAPKTSPPPEPLVQAPADEQFPMQIIKGTEISEAIFKHKFDDPTHWTNSSQGSDSAGDSKPAPTTPPDDADKKADKSKTPSTKAEDGSPKDGSKQDNPATHS